MLFSGSFLCTALPNVICPLSALVSALSACGREGGWGRGGVPRGGVLHTGLVVDPLVCESDPAQSLDETRWCCRSCVCAFLLSSPV